LLRRAGVPAGLGAPAVGAAVATAAAAPEATAAGLGARFIDGEVPAAEVLVVQHADRLLRFLVGRHLDEREPAGTAGGHVAHHADRVHGAGAGEQALKILLGDAVGKVADVKFSSHV
jgi:hypothetical protein